jgi:alpha-tubulin suppressor-like RCC1 family protein
MTETTSKIKFAQIARSIDGSDQHVGITFDGSVYTWGRSNAMGQLGRKTLSRKDCKTPTLIVGIPTRAIRCFAGGTEESGHTAVLDDKGYLWLAGCDRWQQLGLGSSEGGASGYTWENGQILRDFFTSNPFLQDFLSQRRETIRDIALGADHTLVLSSNQKNVYAFGKGGEGQLGLVGKPFVSAIVQSTKLSSSQNEISAVCAIQNCSLTLDKSGTVLKSVGRCHMITSDFQERLQICIAKADENGFIETRTSRTK